MNERTNENGAHLLEPTAENETIVTGTQIKGQQMHESGVDKPAIMLRFQNPCSSSR